MVQDADITKYGLHKCIKEGKDTKGAVMGGSKRLWGETPPDTELW